MAVQKIQVVVQKTTFARLPVLAARDDLSCPLHDHPMFRAVKVFLQRKRAAGLYDNALHTVTGGNTHVLVIAPGTVNADPSDGFACARRRVMTV